MNANGTRLLCQANDGVLHFLGTGHHQIREFVDHDDHVGKFLRYFVRFLVADTLFDEAVVTVFVFEIVEALEIPDADLGEQVVTLVHLAHEPLEGCRRFLGISDHRVQQMGNILEGRKLDHFRVHQNQFQFFR